MDEIKKVQHSVIPLVVSPPIPISLSPELIVPILSDVPHPWQGLVPRLLYNLQVPHLNKKYSWKTSSTLPMAHLNTRGGEVRNLKLDIDWRFSLIEIPCNTGQTKVSLHDVFLSSWE